MSQAKTRLKLAQDQAESAIEKLNDRIGDLGTHTSRIYSELNTLQQLFDKIRNVPSEKILEFEKLTKIRLNWKQQAEKIESDYKKSVTKNAGKGAAGVGAGIAVVALGPTVAMGYATTIGIASTGTAISTLSGAAATNAALAWLGGGALTAGGGGMVAGKAILALAGPIGWGIGAVALLGSGILLWNGRIEQNRLEEIFALISKRDVKSYELGIVELNERIKRIIDESQKLNDSIKRTKTFGLDYNSMTEAQQFELGSYVNLMNSSTQLLVNPIIGLLPKYDSNDFDRFINVKKKVFNEKQSNLIISLSNLLYEIGLDEKDKQLIWKALRKNSKFLSSIDFSKQEFEFTFIETVDEALKYKNSLGKIWW